MSTYRGAGVYVFRTRRPGIIGRLPAWLAPVAFGLSAWGLLVLGYSPWFALLAFLFNSRHFAYVGETGAMQLRKSAHLYGGGKFKAEPKPWADLDPSHYFLRLPASKRLLRFVETLGIMAFWPVYNHKKNLWNPRRISLTSARAQRAMRDRWGWSVNISFLHVIMIFVGILAAIGGM
jgi:hypothetical protein